jgi:lipopolysaccharide biosynthesis regulator YciM
MPTESTFLFAGLLFLAAALGYVFARFGDADEEEEAEQSQRATFLRGFRYLLNEEADRAVDVFTTVGELNDEAIETQLALGTLFRRRGEVERAIRLHQHLVDRPANSVAQREAASFALADDYLSAGLFDRAEELFDRLRDSRAHAVEALRRLLRICEATSDWDRAVDLCAKLDRLDAGSVNPAQLAHYYCELAEQALRSGDAEQATQMLGQAEAIDPDKARAALIRADLEIASGRSASAVATLKKLGQARPTLLGEILPRLLAAAGASTGDSAVLAALEELAKSPAGLRGIALGVVRDDGITDPQIVAFLSRFVSLEPALRELAPGSPEGSEADGVARLRPLLNKLVKAGTRFQCGNCGYGSGTMHWQCPGCRSWDTVRPVNGAMLDGILS